MAVARQVFYTTQTLGGGHGFGRKTLVLHQELAILPPQPPWCLPGEVVQTQFMGSIHHRCCSQWWTPFLSVKYLLFLYPLAINIADVSVHVLFLLCAFSKSLSQPTISAFVPPLLKEVKEKGSGLLGVFFPAEVKTECKVIKIHEYNQRRHLC